MNKITFEEIKNFTINELSLSKDELITEETCLTHDLGVAGDDGIDYMTSFSKEFKMSLENFNYIEYFGHEKSASVFETFNYLYDRFVKQIPTKDLIKAPRLHLGHLLTCANLGKWTNL